MTEFVTVEVLYKRYGIQVSQSEIVRFEVLKIEMALDKFGMKSGWTSLNA